jgi:hypothetical protein
MPFCHPLCLPHFSRYRHSVDQYYIETTLKHLPPALTKIDAHTQLIMEPEWIEKPPLKHHVCCLVLAEDLGDIEMDPRIGLSIRLNKGDIYRVPYQSVRQLVHEFKVLLL